MIRLISRFFQAGWRKTCDSVQWLCSWRLVREPQYTVEQQEQRDWLVNLVSRRPSDEELLARFSVKS